MFLGTRPCFSAEGLRGGGKGRGSVLVLVVEGGH